MEEVKNYYAGSQKLVCRKAGKAGEGSNPDNSNEHILLKALLKVK